MPNRPPTHKPNRPRQTDPRPSACRRGYDGLWRKFRLMVLASRPVCEAPGCNRPGEHLDHRVSLADGGPRLDEANITVLCASCHSKKTCRVDGGFTGKGVRR